MLVLRLSLLLISISLLLSDLYGPFTGAYNVSCQGNETSIKNCKIGAWSNSSTCASNHSAMVSCSGMITLIFTHLISGHVFTKNKMKYFHKSRIQFPKIKDDDGYSFLARANKITICA